MFAYLILLFVNDLSINVWTPECVVHDTDPLMFTEVSFDLSRWTVGGYQCWDCWSVFHNYSCNLSIYSSSELTYGSPALDVCCHADWLPRVRCDCTPPPYLLFSTQLRRQLYLCYSVATQMPLLFEKSAMVARVNKAWLHKTGFAHWALCERKNRKNCECCPVSQLIVRKQRLSWIQVLNCLYCN